VALTKLANALKKLMEGTSHIKLARPAANVATVLIHLAERMRYYITKPKPFRGWMKLAHLSQKLKPAQQPNGYREHAPVIQGGRNRVV
jgi:hypothetical protein